MFNVTSTGGVAASGSLAPMSIAPVIRKSNMKLHYKELVMPEFEWSLQVYYARDVAEAAQDKYRTLGYNVGDVEEVKDIDEKSGAIVPLFQIQINKGGIKNVD